MVSARRMDLAGRHDRRARSDVQFGVLAQPLLASPRVGARVGGDVDCIGAQPQDLRNEVSVTHDELAAERMPEIGERLEQECCSVRASEQSVVEHEEWNDLLETLGCRCERGIVVDPQVAAEEDDSDAHQRSVPSTVRGSGGAITTPRRWRPGRRIPSPSRASSVFRLHRRRNEDLVDDVDDAVGRDDVGCGHLGAADVDLATGYSD